MRMKEAPVSMPVYPERIVIELTSHCNLSCPMCPRVYMQEECGYMEKALWSRLIDEIALSTPGSVIIPFWRGESLLHPEFSEFISYALRRDLRIHLATNGHLMTGEYAAIAAECELVTFSIHTPIGYTRARDFLSLREGGRPAVQISFVTGEPTEGLLNDAIKSPCLDGFDSVRLYEEHSRDGLFGKSERVPDGGRRFCPTLKDTVVIAFNGGISRCHHIWKTEESVNIARSSIRDIWNSETLMRIRDWYPDDACSVCDQWTGHTYGEAWQRSANGIVHRS